MELLTYCSDHDTVSVESHDPIAQEDRLVILEDEAFAAGAGTGTGGLLPFPREIALSPCKLAYKKDNRALVTEQKSN